MANFQCIFVASVIGLTLVGVGETVRAGAVELQRSWRHDAALHDVQMISPRQGWAVGDHGTLWQTTNAGKSWQLIETGTFGALRSVCLLTDQVGWIAGWQLRGAAELTEPVLMMTRDGGQSWQPLETKSLSPLRYVRFSGLEEGMVVGEPTRDNPTGVWITRDGGQTWNPMAGRSSRGYHAVSLSSVESGLLADRDGNLSILAGGQLLPSRLPALQGRSVRGIVLSQDDEGWLVGDGGLLLNSKTGGVVWEPSEGSLPEDVRQVSDFRTVALQGRSLWVAGNPGGVIWHSPDGGRRWLPQSTGSALPINRVQFITASHGTAVGELGTILATDDGGETWNAAQGRGRHTAVLAIHSRLWNLSTEMVSKMSGDQGYRSAAFVATRPAEMSGPLSAAERVSQAITQTGGSTGLTSWQLPLDVEGLDLDAVKLLENWKRRTEGQLQPALVGRLVREIRTWRPLVVVVDQPAPEDAVGQLVLEATQHALEQAADSTRYVAHRELGGLSPWKVERCFLQLLPGSTGEITVDPFEFLPRWNSNARMASAMSRDLLGLKQADICRPNYRPINLDASAGKIRSGADFFAGLSLAPGSDVRRELLPIDEQQLDLRIKAVQKHRNTVAHAERSFDDPQMAGAMLAQLNEVAAGMTAEQAALTLFDVFEQYRRRGRYDLAEATGREMIRNYPEQSVSAEVAQWTLTALTSEEVAWQRVQQLKDERNSKPGASPSLIRQVGRRNQWNHMPELKERLRHGQQTMQYLESQWPRGSSSAEVQFPFAAMCRARGSHGQADAIYRQWAVSTEEQDHRDWTNVVQREIWLSQQSEQMPAGVTPCLPASAKPELDGLLSDDCWQEAQEVFLSHRDPATLPEDSPLVMLAYDEEFLYVAASVPRLAGQSTDPPQTAGRTHDADLRRHDHVTLLLDVDRDYTTWYTLQFDQRGWTAESCWQDANWNPQWYVAAKGDSSHWRAELAIPLNELTGQRPKPGMAWAIRLERTAPAAGKQTWLPSNSSQPVGSTLGLLRFE